MASMQPHLRRSDHGIRAAVMEPRRIARDRQHKLLNAEAQRIGIRLFFKALGISTYQACKTAQVWHNVVYNFLGGVSSGLSLATIQRVDRAFPGFAELMLHPELVEDILESCTAEASQTLRAELEQVTGADISSVGVALDEPGGASLQGVEVLLQARAGVLVDGDHRQQGEATFVGVPMRAEWAEDAFGVEVAGDGQIYAPGSMLVCMPVDRRETELEEGRRVVLASTNTRRKSGPRTEITVREVIKTHGKLHLRSNDGLASISLPPRQRDKWVWETETLKLLGLVVMACIPEGTP